MTANKKSLLQTLKTFPSNFWVVSLLQLMERWDFYGTFTLLLLYLVASTGEGGLGPSHSEKGSIIGNMTAIQYFLPLVFGVIADHTEYRLLLTISCLIMAASYYLMGEVNTYWPMYMVLLFAATGGGFFKPVINGTIARNTNDTTSTLGFGIFYMMVNIGGFIGSAMSSSLRTILGWCIISVRAAVVMVINLLVVLFFYREPRMTQRDSKPLLTEIKESVLHIIEALRDSRLTMLLILTVGFQMMFNQLFYTPSNLIQDWVDSSAMSQWISQYSPFLGTMLTENGQVKAKRFVNIDSLVIIFFQVVVSYLVTKMTHVSAMMCGIIIGTIGVTLTFMFSNVWFATIGTTIFLVGEMAVGPMLSASIAQITPKGKEVLCQDTYFLPVTMGNYLAGLIPGDLHEKWSDKYALLQAEMANRQITMPERPTKSEHFALAEQKSGLSQSQVTEVLWQTYIPEKMRYLIFGIGVFTAISLYLYNKIVVKKTINQ